MISHLQKWAVGLLHYLRNKTHLFLHLFSLDKKPRGTRSVPLLCVSHSAKPVQSAEALHDTWGCSCGRSRSHFFHGQCIMDGRPVLHFPQCGEGKQARFCAFTFICHGFHPSDQCIFTTGLSLCVERGLSRPLWAFTHSASPETDFFFSPPPLPPRNFCKLFKVARPRQHTNASRQTGEDDTADTAPFPALYSLHRNNTYRLYRKIRGAAVTKQ